jgi:Etoposide-induced protein 2.4 (EI24)
MRQLFDAFWRAVVYCAMPRVIVLSLMPLAIMVTLALVLGYFFWDLAIDSVRSGLESSAVLVGIWNWLTSIGLAHLKTVVAPLIVIVMVTPVIVIVSLLIVAVLMTPALTQLVSERRFAHLEQKRGASIFTSLMWSLLSLLLASIALAVSVPLWVIPPLVVVIPPLIWGWLTYRVMAFDVLAQHASADERRELFKRHRYHFLVMGIVTGFLGAAPGVVWASGALFAAMFVILVPIAIWIYTAVFAFSSLWFAHYALSALQAYRAECEQAQAQAAAQAAAQASGFSAMAGEVIDVQATTVQPDGVESLRATQPGLPALTPQPQAPQSFK